MIFSWVRGEWMIGATVDLGVKAGPERSVRASGSRSRRAAVTVSRKIRRRISLTGH